MTCIAGWLEKGKVWMGADSAGVAGWDLTVRADPKLFKVGEEFLIGATSSFRMLQLLRYQIEIPEHPQGMDDFEYMVRHFVEAVRLTFDEFKFGKREGNAGDEGGWFIVGYRGGLYVIQSDFQVAVSQAPFAAVGCGAHFALGALDALRSVQMDPDARLRAVLTTAENWSAGVRGPFLILNL